MPITVLDVPANKFIKAYAMQLKAEGKYEVPAWATFVKTGVAQQFAPEDSDWFYVRGAAILRRLYCQEPMGRRSLRYIFGKAQDGRSQQNHFKPAAGAIILHSLHQLEKLGLVEKNGRDGRKLTAKGRKALDQFASQIK